MRITIVYDNTALPGFEADWGFSCLVEARDRKILFDTGASGEILLSNMEKLKINAGEITDVFISHYHYDHTGGLKAFLERNSNVSLWVPPSFSVKWNVKEVHTVSAPQKLYEGIYSTGEIDGIEQSLCVETKRGIVIIVGCCHPPLKKILDVASRFGKVYGVIGGFHGNVPSSFEGLSLICATHCTFYKKEIEELYPQAYVEGGVGKIIEIP